MDIPLPQTQPDIYSLGFDQNLNQPLVDNNTPVTPSLINQGSNASILTANFQVSSGPSAYTTSGKVTTVAPTGPLQIQPVGDGSELFLLSADGLPGGASAGGNIDIFAGYGRSTNLNDQETADGGDVDIEAGGASKNGNGGRIFIISGAGAFTSGVGHGGVLTIRGGHGGATGGNGAYVDIQGGSPFATNYDCGEVYISGGNSASSGALNINGGTVFISGGSLATGNLGSSGSVVLGNPGKVYIQKEESLSQHAIFNANNIFGGNKTFSFPNKTGMFALTGTFSVQLPSVAATTSAFSTIVTVSGIRVEDALTVTRSDQGVTAGYSTTTTAKIFYSAIPGNGQITLNFINLGAATGYTQHTFSYTAASSAQ